MVEKVFAAVGLLLCVAALLGMLLGRQRLQRWRNRAVNTMGWYRRRAKARSEAAQVIDRARRTVEREGNVYRPKSFGGRPPDDKLH